MEGGVEGGDLGKPRESVGRGIDQLQGPPGVEGVDLGELAQGLPDRGLEEHRLPEAQAALDQPVADGVGRRDLAQLLERRPGSLQAAVPVLVPLRLDLLRGGGEERPLEAARSGVQDEGSLHGLPLVGRYPGHRQLRISSGSLPYVSMNVRWSRRARS